MKKRLLFSALLAPVAIVLVIPMEAPASAASTSTTVAKTYKELFAQTLKNMQNYNTSFRIVYKGNLEKVDLDKMMDEVFLKDTYVYATNENWAWTWRGEKIIIPLTLQRTIQRIRRKRRWWIPMYKKQLLRLSSRK